MWRGCVSERPILRTARNSTRTSSAIATWRVDLELVDMALGLVGAAVTVAAFVREQVRRRRVQRNTRRALAVVAVAVSATALAWTLRRQP